MELQYMKNNIKRERGKFVCPHNSECRCEKLKCGECGWNPKVAKARKEAFFREMGHGEACQ